jgi:pimeloyl-ACP methyl ester carboxylesterase
VPLPRRVSDTSLMRVFYLHGFASSSQSTKAGYFAERLRPHGIELQCPDFNAPDFSTLTMTRMLDDVARRLGEAEGTATLIGSSLGGALAVLAAARAPERVDRLVLLAPAVMFAKPGHHLLPPERIEEWRRAGSMPFFHYAFGEERRLNWEFYVDTLRYDPFETGFSQPTLIFQGVRDASVDYRTVEVFARTRPNVTLSLLDDDHQLTASLPRLWTDIEPFLGLSPDGMP